MVSAFDPSPHPDDCRCALHDPFPPPQNIGWGANALLPRTEGQIGDERKGEEMAKLDWKAIESRQLSVGTLMKLASDLKDEDGENAEYERALAELVTDAAGLSMDFKRAVAKRIGLKAKVE